MATKIVGNENSSSTKTMADLVAETETAKRTAAPTTGTGTTPTGHPTHPNGTLKESGSALGTLAKPATVQKGEPVRTPTTTQPTGTGTTTPHTTTANTLNTTAPDTVTTQANNPNAANNVNNAANAQNRQAFNDDMAQNPQLIAALATVNLTRLQMVSCAFRTPQTPTPTRGTKC